jgi:anti-sigma factor RsiW
MACPDELTLDLWMAGALPSEEAATVDAHVRTCATCAAAAQATHALGGELRSALELDVDERAYLAVLELAANWRTSPATAAVSWGWLALAVVIAGFAAWFVAGPAVGSALALAIQVGVGTVLLNAAVGLMLSVGQALLDLARNPALGLAQPFLALVALALLFWPRQLTSQRSTHS